MIYKPSIRKLTEAEMAENRRQEGLLGMKLTGRKLYCEKKLTDSCKHIFYDVPKVGRCGIDDDGRHSVQIFSLNLDIKTKLAAMSSDKDFHSFLNECYDRVCELHAKRLEAAAAAVKDSEDNSKKCQTETEELQKKQTCRQADRLLLQQQKIKKPQLPFDQNNFKSWSSLNEEDAPDSKGRLTGKRTGLLKKVNDDDLKISSLESEREPFDKKITELKAKLDTDLSEDAFKDVKLSLEYFELKIEKIQTKIEKHNEEKLGIQVGLDRLEKQISVLECVIDAQQLQREVKNFEDRKNRVITRVEKVLRERSELDTLRTSLNQRWVELTQPEEVKRESVYTSSKPELCEPLGLKASATNYFI